MGTIERKRRKDRRGGGRRPEGRKGKEEALSTTNKIVSFPLLPFPGLEMGFLHPARDLQKKREEGGGSHFFCPTPSPFLLFRCDIPRIPVPSDKKQRTPPLSSILSYKTFSFFFFPGLLGPLRQRLPPHGLHPAAAGRRHDQGHRVRHPLRRRRGPGHLRPRLPMPGHIQVHSEKQLSKTLVHFYKSL